MENLMIIFQIFIAITLVIIAFYSLIYFFQIVRAEKQFGLKIPNILKRTLSFMAMLPMVASLVVLFALLFAVV